MVASALTRGLRPLTHGSSSPRGPSQHVQRFFSAHLQEDWVAEHLCTPSLTSADVSYLPVSPLSSHFPCVELCDAYRTDLRSWRTLLGRRHALRAPVTAASSGAGPVVSPQRRVAAPVLCPCGVAPRSSTARIAWGAQRWPHACLSSPCFSGRAPPEGPESVLAAQAPQGLRGRVWGSSSRKPLPAVPVSTAVSVSAPAGVAEPASLNDITSWHPSVKERPPVFLFLLL